MYEQRIKKGVRLQITQSSTYSRKTKHEDNFHVSLSTSFCILDIAGYAILSIRTSTRDTNLQTEICTSKSWSNLSFYFLINKI